MPVCGWTHPAGCAPLSSSRKPAPAQVSGRPLSDALLTQSLLFCLDYFLGSSPDSGVGNQARKKITNRGTGGTAHEEQCETDHREVEAASYPWGWRDNAECCFCRGSPELLPSTRCGWLSVTCNSSFRGSNALLRLSRSCVHIT